MTDDCRPSVWPGQLTSGDQYGSYNCAAYALAKGLEFDTCGQVVVSGARVRQLTNEPVPDPKSPGLHHGQLRDVAAKFGVRLDLINGGSWGEVEDAQDSGHAVLLAVGYTPIRPTVFSGQHSFYGGHEILIMPGWFVYDALCDGRISGGQRVFRGPAVYPEALLMQAAGMFKTKSGLLGFGRAVAAVLPHRHPLGGAVPVPTPRPIPAPTTPTKEGNVAILGAYTGHTYRMSKGQKLYRSPTGAHVTTLAKDGSVEYIGKAGQGWVALRIGTGALYPDGVVRPTVLYAPAAAGVLE